MFFNHLQEARNRYLSGPKGSRVNKRRWAWRKLRVETLERRDLLAISPQALLPDLIPWSSQSKGFISGWTIVGNDLRLTTAMANIGTGAMELRGGATHSDESQDVYQRVFEPNGTYTDVLAGTFTYHPEHGHIHFDDFAQFRLRQVLPGGGVGDIVAAGNKVSFCLLDVERYNSAGPGSPHYLNCGQIQGISVGWADIYDKGLEGQSIEITNVPDGSYWLEVVVDPDNRIVEANENNNVARIQINLSRPANGGGAIAPDAFEPNNNFDTASILAPPEDHLYDNLSIHASLNDDYFRVTASASGAMSVRLAFQHSRGDIDLDVFDANRTRIGRSDSDQNSEQFSFNAVAGQFYYVRVYGFEGATNRKYSMTIDQPEGVSGGSPDQFEENDSFAAARSLPAVDQSYTNLNINTSNDDDYYKIVPTVSGTMVASLAFTHAQGDIDMSVLNAAGAQIKISDSDSNAEKISLAVTAGTAYYIRVFGYNGATNPSYSMTIDVPNPPPPGDFYVSTAENGTVTSTDGSSSLSFTDADILKLSVQVNGLYGYQLHFDGSDVGLTTSNEDIDAFCFLPDGSIIMSTAGTFSVPGPSGTPITGNGEDLLRFVPTSVGATTAGTWSMYFDGSDVGLSASSENIDAVAVLSDGRVLISTTGSFSVPGATGDDEDLVSFTPTTFGAATSGTWSFYFDGSDVGLTANDAEDVDALDVRETGGNPILYFSTRGNFSVTGVSGANEDVAAFTPTTLGSTTAGTFASSLAFDGSLLGLSSFNVDGFHLVPASSSILASGLSSASTGALAAGASLRSIVETLPAANKKSAPTIQAKKHGSSAPSATLMAALASFGTSTKSGSNGASTSSLTPTSTSGNNSNAIFVDWDELATVLDALLPPLRTAR